MFSNYASASFFISHASVFLTCDPASALVFMAALFSLKISLTSIKISLLTSVGFLFPRLQSRCRVGDAFVIVCLVVCWSRYSWTEAHKLRNYDLSCSHHPPNAFVYGKTWELLFSKGQWFITLPVVFHYLESNEFWWKVIVTILHHCHTSILNKWLTPAWPVFQTACLFQLEAFS